MSISSVSAAGGSYGAAAEIPTGAAPSSGSLTMEGFMQLMAVQLQNQDVSNSMDNSEMMNQLTQMATVQAMNTFTDLAQTQYAMTMIGQEVKVARMGENGKMGYITGKVVGVDVAANKLYLEGDSNPYGLGNVMQVGNVPEPPKEEEEDKDKEEDSDTGTTDGPGGSDEDSGVAKTRLAAGKEAEASAASVMDDADLPADKAAFLASRGVDTEKLAAASMRAGMSSDKLASPYRDGLGGPGVLA